MSSSAPARKSKGRQKVRMAKMENQSNLQVTFSKRRAGLFKKASELCTLCGAEAAIVVFSPANKAYCFGHPNVKTVVDRLAAGMDSASANPRTHLIIEAHRNSTIREHNIELTRVESLLRAERRRAEEIHLLRKAGRMQGWLPPSLEGLDFAQLRALEESVMGFKKDVDARVEREMFRVSHHHPNGFALDNVPTFDLSLGIGDFSAYAAPASSGEQVALNNGGSSVGGLFNVGGGGTNYDHHQIVGSKGVGFALGHANQMFQMF